MRRYGDDGVTEKSRHGGWGGEDEGPSGENAVREKKWDGRGGGRWVKKKMGIPSV